MNTISTNMRENGRRTLRLVAVTLSLLVYAAGLLYAGVRSYDLFSRTLPADMIALALLGILALEFSALGLPLAVHYWTDPGPQRLAAYVFYAVDLGVIIANAVVDSARNTGTLLPEFLQGYATFALPGLPVLCIIGWALIWALDPTTREHDLRASVRAATQQRMADKILEAVDEADVSAPVARAAREVAAEWVGDTVERTKRTTTRRKKESEPEPVTVEVPADARPKAQPAPHLNGKAH